VLILGRRQPLDEDPHLAEVFRRMPTPRSSRASPPSRMPELPEVERRAASPSASRAGVASWTVWCAEDPIVFERIPAARWRRALRGGA